MRIDVVTIFPEYLTPLRLSLVGKAQASGLLDIRIHDLRDHAHDRHRTVDDTPYGGGPGMVMRPEPWGEAIDELIADGTRATLIVPTPAGTPFTQALAAEFAESPHLIFACGRYEGIDARVVEHYTDRCDIREISIGDYVLAGGEVAALVIVEAVTRLLPGVLGNEVSVVDDSFAPGAMARLLEGPVYTKPVEWRGLKVSDVLRSGDHGAIAAWRRLRSQELTAARRPDLTI